MKKTLLTVICVAFSMALNAADQAKNSTSQAPNSSKTQNPDEVIIGFTKGDQTDIFAIPLDDDQLEQQEELDTFEAESKAYLNKQNQGQTGSK